MSNPSVRQVLEIFMEMYQEEVTYLTSDSLLPGMEISGTFPSMIESGFR